MNYAKEVLEKELNMLLKIMTEWRYKEEYLTQYKRLLKRVSQLQKAIDTIE